MRNFSLYGFQIHFCRTSSIYAPSENDTNAIHTRKYVFVSLTYSVFMPNKESDVGTP